MKQQMLVGQGSRWPLGGGIRPGRVSAHVRGRVVSLASKRWKATAVVSVNNRGFTKKQGIKLMAAASLLEGTIHPFRRTAGRMRRGARAAAKANLAKGLE